MLGDPKMGLPASATTNLAKEFPASTYATALSGFCVVGVLPIENYVEEL